MAVITSEEFRESLRKFKPSVYMLGEKIENVWDHPKFQSTLNILGALHDFSFDPEFKDLSVVHSPLVDEPVRRLNLHIQTTMEDSIIKCRLTREVTQRRICTWCGSNVLCLVWASTWEADQKHGGEYHQRFIEYVKYMMRNDYTMLLAKMDPKGDRSLPPSQQANTTGVKVIKKDGKGITVRGAKVHTSYGCCAQEVLVMPCRALGEDDKDYAVSFSVPVDTPGINFVCRPAPGRDREEDEMECPMGSAIGAVEGMTVFEDVFVPWERVFLCGEYDMAARFPYYFGNIQRQSKCSCLAGHTDLVCGVASLVTEVNGLSTKVHHIRDKLTRLMVEAETAQGCALGSAVEGGMHPSGVYMPNPLTVNAGLNYIKGLAGEHIQLLHDIAGGLIVTMPTEADYKNPTIKAWMDEFLCGSGKYSTQDRLRALYLAREIAATKFTGYFMGWAVNASGSPAAAEVVVRNEYDLEKRVDIAKGWAGITTR